MAIVHIVQFQFKSSVQAETITNTCSHLLSLKDTCIHPDTNRAYILNASGGRNNSPEGMHQGLTHAFVIIFESEADRDYYVDKDPAHLEFAEKAKDLVENVTVVDYEPNAF